MKWKEESIKHVVESRKYVSMDMRKQKKTERCVANCRENKKPRERLKYRKSKSTVTNDVLLREFCCQLQPNTVFLQSEAVKRGAAGSIVKIHDKVLVKQVSMLWNQNNKE